MLFIQVRGEKTRWASLCDHCIFSRGIICSLEFMRLSTAEMTRERIRYSTVAAVVASNPLKVRDSTCCDCQQSSATPMTMAREEFFILFKNSLPSGGIMFLKASGRII